MSLNQDKRFWELNKDDILKNLEKDKFYAIKISKEYYQKNHIEDMKNFINNNKN